MKWFKHMSDMSYDPKIQNIEKWYGLEGYARWLKILEIIASDMNESDRCSVTLDERIWKDRLRFYRLKEMQIYLQSIADLGLIHLQCTSNPSSMSGQSITILCDKLLKIRARQKPIGSKTRRLEVEVEVEVDKERGREPEKVPFKPVGLSPLSIKWNEICVSFPKVVSFSKSRKVKEQARLRDVGSERLIEAMRRLERSDFCKGTNQRGWTATYDWLIANDANALKVLEGSYETKKEDPMENAYRQLQEKIEKRGSNDIR